jgi:hypothetical protein
MCVVSMIMDHYDDEWRKRANPPEPQPIYVPMVPWTPQPIQPHEIDEFRRLLERAREYDKKNNEPDCEMESKRQKLLDLAKQLGIDISFV